MTPKNEVGAADWLASRGLADLSLYWPHPKPIPQKDYPANEPQPTLTGIMAAFASSIQEEARQSEEYWQIAKREAAAHIGKLEQQLAEARAHLFEFHHCNCDFAESRAGRDLEGK